MRYLQVGIDENVVWLTEDSNYSQGITGDGSKE